MNKPNDLHQQVMRAARENNVSSALLRNAIGRKIGLNVADVECMSLLAIQHIATPKELARYTGLTTGSTTAMLDRLERAGFITRKPNPQDGRGVLVEMSPLYTQKVLPYVAGLQQTQGTLLDQYNEEELKVVADFLSRFSDNVSDHVRSIEDA